MLDVKDASELNKGQGSNRFKYRSFNQRVETLKVDVVRRSRLVHDDLEENESFFYDALVSWRDLNLTRHFKQFNREISPYCKSLVAVVHHKDTIIDLLEKHLLVPQSLALDALLDLVTKLAKDLEGEFYPYYTRILKCMLPLVHHQDVALLECLFNSLAYLFKFLSRQILPDIEVTFDLLAKLLGEDTTTKPYIRHFSAEAFAFLMRKVRADALKKLVKHILHSLDADPSLQYIEGLAMLFFECCKQVDGCLHSRAVAIYTELYVQACAFDGDVAMLASSAVYDLLRKTTLLVLHHTKRQHFTPLLNVVLEQLDTHLAKKPTPDQKHLAIDMSVLSMIVTVRKASRVEDFKAVLHRLQTVTKLVFATNKPKANADLLCQETLHAVTGVLCFGSLDVVVSGGRLILEHIAAYPSPQHVFGFFVGLADLEWSNFTQIALAYITKCVAQFIKKSPTETVYFLAQLLSRNALSVSPGMMHANVTPKGLLRFPSPLDKPLLKLLTTNLDWQQQVDAFNNFDHEDESPTASGLATLSCVLTIVPAIELSAPREMFDAVLALADTLRSAIDALEDNSIVSTSMIIGHRSYALTTLLGQTLQTLAGLARDNPAFLPLLVARHADWLVLLSSYPQSAAVVKGIYEYMHLVHGNRELKGDRFTVEELQNVYTTVKANLRSNQRHARLYTLKLLVLFDQPLMKKDADHRVDEPCDMVNTAHNMEAIVPTLTDYRDKIILIQKISLMSQGGRVPDMYDDMVPLLCLGLFTVNFKPLWEEARKALKAFAETNRDLYWRTCFDEIAKFEDDRQLVFDGLTRSALEACHAPLHIPKGKATKTGNISFECPTLTKYFMVEDNALSIMGPMANKQGVLLFVKACEQDLDHMDYWNYFHLILKTMTETPAIVEQRSRHLIPLFFRFLDTEYQSLLNDDEKEELEGVDQLGLIPRSARHIKNKMVGWLSLLATFTNPRSLFRTEEIYTVLLRLIAKGDHRLQGAALEALFTWKDRNIKPYADNLRNLVDDTKFRDELSTLLQNKDQEAIDPAHRPGLMPIIMRVLYGRFIERPGKANNQVKKMRRKAILSAVAACRADEIGTFLHLALEAFQPIIDLPGNEDGTFAFEENGLDLMRAIPWRQQQGLVTALDDIIKQLGATLLPFMPQLLKVVLYILHFAQNGTKADDDAMDVDEQEDEEQDEDEKEDEKTQSNRSRNVRNTAVHRLVELFQIKGGYVFDAYIPAMFASFISPRLYHFAEQSQNVSGLLSLFHVWATEPAYLPYLADFDQRLLPEVYSILGARTVDRRVLETVLTILEHVLDYCDEHPTDSEKAIAPQIEERKARLVYNHIDALLQHFLYRLTQSKDDKRFGSGAVSVRQIALVARLAPHVTSGARTVTLLDILIPNLKKHPRYVPEHTKKHILSIWAAFLPLLPGFEVGTHVFLGHFRRASELFGMLQSREARVRLTAVFRRFVDADEAHLGKVGALLDDLNAYSVKRIDEPDYDRILGAMSEIGEELYASLDHYQWLPLLFQLFHHMRDKDELSVRGTATHCVSRFLTQLKTRMESDETDQLEKDETQKQLDYVKTIVYPTIKNGLHSHAEVVRVEYVNLLNACVKTLPTLPFFAPMVILAPEGDEENNFFANIYHIQMHRRLRAMARLVEVVADENGTELSVPSILHLLLPLISGFLHESDRSADSNLIHQAVITIGALSRHLPWGHYYRLLSSYLSMVNRNEEKEKMYVRLVTSVLDAFHFDISQVEVTDAMAAKVMGKQKLKIDYLTHEEIVQKAKRDKAKADAMEEIAMDVDDAPAMLKEKEKSEEEKAIESEDDQGENEENEQENEAMESDEDQGDMQVDEEEKEEDQDDNEDMQDAEDDEPMQEVARPDAALKIHNVIVSKVLPELNAFIAKTKSRKSVISRMPVALGIAKLLRRLPEKTMVLNLPGLLTIVCQTTRSRAEDVRETARDTLIKINDFLGKQYFKFIVKELVTALVKGYELHVLGYTLNALLNDMVPRLQVGDLDDSLQDVVKVLVADIFGKAGQEKDADGMTGKIMEARSRRSPAAFELLAKIVSFTQVSALLLPLKDIMTETQSIKTLKKVDDLLQRVSHGLVNNPGFESTEMLDFARDLVAENVDAYKSQKKQKVVKSQMELNFEVKAKRPTTEQLQGTDYYAANSYRFVHFGLSLMNIFLKRHKLDLKVEAYATRIDHLIVVVGNVLFSTHTSNVTLASKTLCQLYRLPLPSVLTAVPVTIKRVFQLLKHTTGTHHPMIQACFKLLTVCIQTKKSNLTEHQLTYLLHLLRPDLEEPARQGTAFGLVRAIIARQFLAPEMYDLMDIVASILVTNQAPETREQARSVFFAFLMDYPQGKGRLNKQMTFLLKNLEYVHETGRISVMELLHHIITKFGDQVLESYAQSILLALVMRLVNDDSPKCREMAAELIKALLDRMSNDQLDTVYRVLDKWLDSDNPNLHRAACQVYGFVLDVLGKDFKLAAQLVSRLEKMVREGHDQWTAVVEQQIEKDEDDDEEMDVDIPWETAYYSLNTMVKMTALFPKLIYDADTVALWTAVQSLLLHPHAWIRSSSTRLFGTYFAGVDPAARNPFLDRAMLRHLAYGFAEQLKSAHLTQAQATQIVKNLFFLGKCFYHMPADEDRPEEDASDDDADDNANATDENAQKQTSSLLWLFHRLSYAARGAAKRNRPEGFLMRTSIFKWFAAMANVVSEEDLPTYLYAIIAPIYHTVEATTHQEGFDDVKNLGNEVLSLMQKKAGPTVYFGIYQNVKQHAQDARDERKQKRTQNALQNPALAAKRKMAETQRKNKLKKQKRVRFNS
ncbi:armadillo-type protein [Gongronella butleri]|nr:armadillo-type protein [Gongronella butleri]